MKAYGYLRVSSQGQIESDGFVRQKEAINEYAERNGIEIVEFYQEEGISGVTKEDERPAFKQMVSDILRNGVKTIIIEQMDRLAREYTVQEHLVVYLASKDITLIGATTEQDITADIMGDPMKKALVQMQGIFSELEKNLLVRKLRGARKRKAEETGKCEGRKGWNESPDRQEYVLSRIKKLRRKPRGKNRMTYREVAEQLNKDGILTLTGKPWTGPTIQNFLQRHE